MKDFLFVTQVRFEKMSNKYGTVERMRSQRGLNMNALPGLAELSGGGAAAGAPPLPLSPDVIGDTGDNTVVSWAHTAVPVNGSASGITVGTTTLPPVDAVLVGHDINAAITGTKNTIVGEGSAGAITTAGNSVIIGANSGNILTTASRNVLVGADVDGFDGINQFDAVALGYGTGLGQESVAIGSYASGVNNHIGFDVTMGYQAGAVLSTGQHNTLVGYRCGGDATLAVGVGGYVGLTTQDDNTALGAYALSSATSLQATAVGYESLGFSTGTGNTAIGFQSGQGTGSGGFNCALGYTCGASGTGSYNINIGYETQALIHTNDNIAIGRQAVTTGAPGIAVGATSSAGANCISLGLGAISAPWVLNTSAPICITPAATGLAGADVTGGGGASTNGLRIRIQGVGNFTIPLYPDA